MISLVNNSNIIDYPDCSCGYSPHIKYPEYPWRENTIASENNNYVYDLVRECFRNAGLDTHNYGSKNWNPLGEYISSGQTVLMKPNWVMHANKDPKFSNSLDCLVTHPSVVRAVFDYVVIALKGRGRICIADAPMQSCDLNRLFAVSGYNPLWEYMKKQMASSGYDIILNIQDLRNFYVQSVNKGTPSAPIFIEDSPLPLSIELGKLSLHTEFDKKAPCYKVSDYKQAQTEVYHHDGCHRYEVSSLPFEADVVISMPKPKSHRLAGMTASMKNMVGITYDKACLPHRKLGDSTSGGDSYMKKSRFKEMMQKLDEYRTSAFIKERYRISTLLNWTMKGCYLLGVATTGDKSRIGSWYGNDTIWRTVVDLNYALLYADKKGSLQDTPQRLVITIADMIVAGQGAGPVAPTPKPLGMIMMSDNSLLFDYVMCKIMGFDNKKIPLLRSPLTFTRMGFLNPKDLERAIIVFNNEKMSLGEFKPKMEWAFEPHPDWKGHIEEKNIE